MSGVTAFIAPVWNGGKAKTGASYNLPNRCGRSQSRGKVSKATRAVPATMVFSDAGVVTDEEVFSAKGMSVEQFFERSLGEWRSQRSSHNLAWTQFEQVTSEIIIRKLENTDDEVAKLCQANGVDEADIMTSVKMSWEGESDWDEETSEGESVLCVIKDGAQHGRLLRSIGYAETIPAVGNWEMTEDGVFVLDTMYDAAAAEERIWFATPDLRLRVSQIRTSSGRGVMTASLSSEVRRLNVN